MALVWLGSSTPSRLIPGHFVFLTSYIESFCFSAAAYGLCVPNRKSRFYCEGQAVGVYLWWFHLGVSQERSWSGQFSPHHPKNWATQKLSGMAFAENFELSVRPMINYRIWSEIFWIFLFCLKILYAIFYFPLDYHFQIWWIKSFALLIGYVF